MSEKISKELAEQDFARFAELMDLDVDQSNADENDRKDFASSRDKFLRAIQAGSLVVNDEGEPVFTPQRSANVDPITFLEPTGESFLAMDKKKKSADMAKSFTLLGKITKTEPKRFAAMKWSDLKICLAVMALFLG